MPDTSSEQGLEELKDPVLRTANDRFKAGWGGRLSSSMVMAVVVHGLLFLGWPEVAPETFPEVGGDGWASEVVAFMDASASVPGSPGVIQPSLEESDPVSAEDDDGSGDEGSEPEPELGSWDWDAAGPGSEALRERLRDRAPPTPSVVEAEEVMAAESSSEEGEDARTRIGGAASATDYLDSRTERILDLDRLSAAQPELALFAPSSVFLLRNPGEVDRFLKSRLERRFEDIDESLSVGVAIWIDERGSVEWAEVSQSSGRSDIDEIALQLFSEVVAFHPARERGVRVPVSAIFWLTLPY